MYIAHIIMIHNQIKFHEVLVIGYLVIANFMNFKAAQGQ